MPILKPARGIQLNKSHPLARGLVGYWLFNEGSGNKVFDLSGNGNEGTITGTAPSWYGGKFGFVVMLPGTDEYITVTDFPGILGGFSISMWIKQNAYVDGCGLLDANGGTDYLFGYFKGNKVRFYVGGFTQFVESSKTDFNTDLNWRHIAGTYDGATIRLYINGVIHGTTKASAVGSSGAETSFEIGVYNLTTYFDGFIDIPSFYKRALSAPEIALIYRKPFCMFERAVSPALFFYAPPVAVAAQRRHVGFRPIQGADRLRGLRW